MRVEIDSLDRDAWDAACEPVRAPLQQAWAYGEAMARLGARIRRCVVIDQGRAAALAQVSARKSLGVSFAACAHGPVWLADLAPSDRAQAYRAIRRARLFGRPCVTVFAPFDAAGDKPGHAPGVERMNRLITGRSTVLVDLSGSEEALRAALDGKWRNRLKAAEASALRVSRVGAKPRQYQFILDREEGQRARKGYQALPAALVPAYQAASADRDAVIALRADLGRACVAAMLFLKHGRAATYHMGWADAEGRRLNAHNLLLFEGYRVLKTAGVDQLDLGGVDTEDGAGLARFKLGAGGVPHTPAGTFW